MKRMICMIAIFVMLASLTACDGFSIQINIGGKETTAPSESAGSTLPTKHRADRDYHYRECHLGSGRE